MARPADLMRARVIDGRACAGPLKESLVADLTRLREDGLGIGPATVVVGADYGAGAYERRLRRLAAEVGVPYVPRALPATARTTGLGRHTRWADVLIVAAGKAGLIRAEHVSENAVVIDVGINPRREADGRVRMVGDVDYASVAPRVRAITPVPGGVGPVTDVWLLRSTVAAARLLAGRPVPVFDPNDSLVEVS